MSYQLSELTPSLTVSKVLINVKDLNYKELCECFEPAGDIVVINNNYFHKALDGYESYITKPKSEKSKRKKVSSKKMIGDGSTFNSSIEFMVSDNDCIKLLRYYPRSGQIQIIGCQYSQELINKLISYLRNSGVELFSDVKFESGPHTLLQNYKFTILLEKNQYIDIRKLADCLQHEQELINACPFPIDHVSDLNNAVHSLTKLAIVFTNKIRIHIWTKSGKINIFGSTTELSASLLYEFLRVLFSTCDFACNAPDVNQTV